MRVRDGIGHSYVGKWSNLGEGMVKVVVPVEGDSTRTESCSCVSGGCGAGECGSKMNRGIRYRQPQVNVGIANAIVCSGTKCH